MWIWWHFLLFPFVELYMMDLLRSLKRREWRKHLLRILRYVLKALDGMYIYVSCGSPVLFGWDLQWVGWLSLPFRTFVLHRLKHLSENWLSVLKYLVAYAIWCVGKAICKDICQGVISIWCLLKAHIMTLWKLFSFKVFVNSNLVLHLLVDSGGQESDANH